MTKGSGVSPEGSRNCAQGEQSAELCVLYSTELSHRQEPSAFTAVMEDNTEKAIM